MSNFCSGSGTLTYSLPVRCCRILPNHLLQAGFLLALFSTPKMEVVLYSETSVHTRATLCYVPKDGNINYLFFSDLMNAKTLRVVALGSNLTEIKLVFTDKLHPKTLYCSCQSSWLQIQKFRLRFAEHQIFWGATSEKIQRLLSRKLRTATLPTTSLRILAFLFLSLL
jgi:hypothetical protein